MGTRTKIRIETNGNYICSKYINMDGHIPNWAPTLITALNQTSPETILKNRQIFRFMFDDYLSDDMLSYLCEVDIADGEYHVAVYGYKRELLFEGSLDEFAAKYDEI